MREHFKGFAGVTLIELLVAISILAILLSVAAPSFRDFIVKNRVDTFANTLQASLFLAKSEAIKRNKRVGVCRSSDGASCTGAWNQGWIVFVDANRDGARASTEPILSSAPPQEGSFSLSGASTDAFYDPEGKASMSGDFVTICPPAPAPQGKGKKLVFSPGGTPSISTISSCS